MELVRLLTEEGVCLVMGKVCLILGIVATVTLGMMVSITKCVEIPSVSYLERFNEGCMKFTLLDTATGETKDINDDCVTSFQLAENNWSCDCNRCTYFGLDHEDLGKVKGICFGEKRFIVISVENSDRDYYTLKDYNAGYPEELLQKHGVI